MPNYRTAPRSQQPANARDCRIKPGNAILLNGVSLGANREIGVPECLWKEADGLSAAEGQQRDFRRNAQSDGRADRPETANWLTRDERDVLREVLSSEVRERPHSSLLAALKDTRVLILAAIQFGFTLGSYGIGIWLPLILKEYHLSTWAIGWIAAIPYLFASAGMILWARYVDLRGRRVFNLAITCFLGGAGLVAPILSSSLAIALAGFSVALVGVTAARAIFWTIPTRFLTGVAAAGGLAFINSIGTVGGFVGPSMMGWLKEFSGSYVVGLTAVAVIMIAATVASVSLTLVVSKE